MSIALIDHLISGPLVFFRLTYSLAKFTAATLSFKMISLLLNVVHWYFSIIQLAIFTLQCITCNAV